MKRLQFQTQQELKEFTKTFMNEYQDFFKQNLSRSKTEKFIANLAGVKNYNTLLGKLINTEYKTFDEFSNILYSLENENLHNFIKDNIPKDIYIYSVEEYDHVTFIINKITMIKNFELPDEDDITPLLKMKNIQIPNDWESDYKKSIKYLMKFYKDKISLSEQELLRFVLEFCLMCQEGLLPNRLVELFEELLGAQRDID